MALTRDERALRAALDDLSGDQPPPLPGRCRAVRRRLARRRARQAGALGGVLAIAAAAAIGGGLTARPAGRAPVSRPVPGWALPWPDHRDDSIPQSVLDGAVTAWRYTASPQSGVLPAPRRVIWYVAQVRSAGQDLVVVFELNLGAIHQLVVGIASTAEVMRGQPGWSHGASPWVLATVPAPNPRQPGLAVSFYNVGHVKPVNGPSPDNWIVVLAGPQVRRVTWTAVTATGRHSATTSTSAGLAVADSGQVIGRVLLTGLITSSGNVLRHPVYVGLPGPADTSVSASGPPWYPVLAPPAALRLPQSFLELAGASGTGGTPVESDSSITVPYRPGQRAEVLARCYGPDSLTIWASRYSHSGPALGQVACDNRQHELPVPAPQRLSAHSSLVIKAGSLTSFRVMLGYVG